MNDLNISFNNNVMDWVTYFSTLPEDMIAQEAIDVMLASTMLITTALAFEDAGQLIGKVIVEAVKQAEVAKGLMQK